MITIAEEIQSIENKDIEETINTLKKDYGMSTECLWYLVRVKSDRGKIEIPD